MNKGKNSLLVPSISITAGALAFVILSGSFFLGFNPLKSVAEATTLGSFRHVTNMLNYETSEVSYNMEDLYNSTYLYDFGDKQHFGRLDGSLQSDIGVYGQSLIWPGGQIICEDLNIVDMSFTLEAWIYPSSSNPMALTGCETIFPYILRAQNGSMLYQYSGGSSALYSNRSVELNAWTHVAMVYDSASGVAKWYLNGSEQGSKLIDSIRDWDDRWAIGKIRPDYPTFEWNGKIDEFRIYRGRALTPSRIQEDMETSIARKLILTGLIPNSDVAQLWYPDGEFARAHMLEETADENGQIEFSVYSFSGRSFSYDGVLKLLRSWRTYESSATEFYWGDVYNFSIHKSLNEITIAALIAALIIIVPPTMMIIYRYTKKHPKLS